MSVRLVVFSSDISVGSVGFTLVLKDEILSSKKVDELVAAETEELAELEPPTGVRRLLSRREPLELIGLLADVDLCVKLPVIGDIARLVG